MEKQIGLALGSGGGRGLAHIGVIKSLIQNNIPINFIAGSSIGAMVGGLYAAIGDIKEIERILAPGGMLFSTVSKREKYLDQMKEIAPNTLVPLTGREIGLVHYFFNEDRIRKEFNNFEIDDIWEQSKGTHYCFLGRLKPEEGK